MADGLERYGVPTGRLVTGIVVIPALLFGSVMLWTFAVRSRLPEPMASHWNGSGQANGTMTFRFFIVFVVVLTVGLWAVGAAVVLGARRTRVAFRAERIAMAWCCGLTAFDAALLLLTVLVNLDVPTAKQATLPPLALVPTIAVGLIGALVGFVLAGPKPEVPPTELDDAVTGTGGVAPARLLAGEHPVWHEHLVSPLLAATCIAMGIVGVGLWWLTPFVTVVLLLCSVVTLPLVSVTAIVDGTGLTVHFGPFGWPRKTVPLAEITAVRTIELEPLEWGGWGYRMLPDRRAVVLRRGPAIVVDTTAGRAFAVTVDRPEPGAALLEAYRRRATGEP